VPYVAFGRLDSLPECSCATVDYELGTFECMSRLIGRGHRRIGMLKALRGYQPGAERRRGYFRALENAGIEPVERLIQPVSFIARNVANATYRLLNDKKLTAILDASGMEDAAAIHEGARRAGRVPGKDFEIICWTYNMDVPVMEEACEHLWLPVREAASEGIELFSEWFWEKREGPVHAVYAPTIVKTELLAAKSLEKKSELHRLFDADS
jgi:DNA-binding LacI/PurR family transcriptional regulator